MPDFVSAQIGYFSGAVALMPISSDEHPTVLADLGQEGLVGRPDVGRDVLFVDAISNASPVELFGNF